MSENISKKEIALGLAKALREAVSRIELASNKEAFGVKKLSKNMGGGFPGLGNQVPMARGEPEADESSDGGNDGDNCKACNGRNEHLGSLGNRIHFLCKGCGLTSSKAHDEHVQKKEVLPGDKKSQVVVAEGSGGGIIKKSLTETDLKSVGNMQAQASASPVRQGAGMQATKAAASKPPLQKDAMDVAVGVGARSPMPAGRPKLPGMTPSRSVKPATPNASVSAEQKPAAFIRKPVGEVAKQPDSSEISAAEKKAAGIGFLSNLISKFRGTGNKTWSDLRGAGTVSAGKAVSRMGARMALAETSPSQVQNELKGFKSLAGGAPNQPKAGGTELKGFKSLVHKGETSPSQVQNEMKGFKSLAGGAPNQPKAGAGTELKGFKSLVHKGEMQKDEKGIPAAPKAPGAPAPATATPKAPKIALTGPTGAKGASQSNAAPPSAPAMKSEGKK